MGLWSVEAPSTVFFLLEGHALCRVEVELPVPSLQIALEAPFQPSARFDNVKRDAAYVAALGTLGKQLLKAFKPVFVETKKG